MIKETHTPPGGGGGGGHSGTEWLSAADTQEHLLTTPDDPLTTWEVARASLYLLPTGVTRNIRFRCHSFPAIYDVLGHLSGSSCVNSCSPPCAGLVLKQT